ncbi:MAG TPA: SMP-30/gluconolactonase/LRE family protein [Burkholderiales bacterium]|nr:SMP-30/gluconolactonase/LRE family protein [Burkholderiales bacterium]
MFAPPTVVETSVFARLPDELKNAGPDSSWVAKQPLGTPAGSLLEGPSFDREGNFWCVDIQNRRVFKISKAGEFQLIAEYDGWPNGLKFHRDGRAFIADYKNGIMLLDPVNGKVTPFLTEANGHAFKGCNDLFFAANGDLYFTDQGLTGLHDPTGRLFRMTPQGKVACLLDNIPSPNGLVMNKDETQVLLAVTRGNCVWRVPFVRDGSLAKVGLYIQLSGGGGGPDGLALDEDGGLLVAHVGMGSVWTFNALGEPVHRIVSRVGTHTTNVAFGWPDRDVLYITESASGTILKAKLGVRGKLMYSHA